MRFLLLAVLVACGSKSEKAPPPTPAKEAPLSSGDLIFKDPSGKELKKSDLASATGSVKWELIGGENVPPAAAKLHDEGRAAGSKGDYAKAIESLLLANSKAPNWPYPMYDLAFTYELLDKPQLALKWYQYVLELAPRGYFTAHKSEGCLRRELANEWPAGVCKRLAMVEWMDPTKAQAELAELVKIAPGLAPAWAQMAQAAETDAQALAKYDQALAAKPDKGTRGLALSNKALILDRMGKREEAVKILGALILDPETPLDTVEISKMALAQMTK